MWYDFINIYMIVLDMSYNSDIKIRENVAKKTMIHAYMLTQTSFNHSKKVRIICVLASTASRNSFANTHD